MRVDDDSDWAALRDCWRFEEGTTYLNHGAFGPPPESVRLARRQAIERLERQPMDFFVRRLEEELSPALARLGELVGARGEDLIFVDNATYGMNVVADSVELSPGENVVLTDHSYGAVLRIWQRACREAGADEPRAARLPRPLDSSDEVVEAIFSQVDEETRLIVVSHITSATALVLPVADICREAQRRGVAVCIDGPHAVAQVPLDIAALGCDYYAASCHKWLSAPFGSGFLFVHPRRQGHVRPPILSWGKWPETDLKHWSDEFHWIGTRDPSAFLCVPTAIEFLEDVGWEAFRARTHYLARYAADRLGEVTGLPPLAGRDDRFASMALISLPRGDRQTLQDALWQQHGIEVPVVDFDGGRYLRVSCHLYTTQANIDLLARALHRQLETSSPLPLGEG